MSPASYLQETKPDIALARPSGDGHSRETFGIPAPRPVRLKRLFRLNRAGGINAIASLGHTASHRRVEPPGRVQLLVC